MEKQAIGVGFTYQPAVTVIGHYFQKRLGLANGIAMSGVGIGMLAVPPFLQLLIDTFTWQRTFPILAALVLLLVVCGLLFRPSDRELYFINEKTKHKQLADDAAEDEDTSAAESSRTCYFYLWRCLKFFGLQLIWQMPSINFIFVAFCLLGFGYYSSLVFFTSKAVFDLGIEQTTASWLISLVGIGSFSFRLFHGVLIDLKIVSPMMLFIVSTMMCCISDLLNPFTASFAGLAICAFFLGAGSGMAIAVTIVCIREAVPPTNVPNAWGISMTFLGTGNLIGVYFMAFLYDATGNYNISFFFGAGAFFLGASSMAVLYMLKRLKEKKEASINRGEKVQNVEDYVNVEENGLKEEFQME
ncbi:putative monocarboxylate transporter 13 [Apostichopus japonicus]|uniref:Putative monocarboxylate transporter 13 n=1 Tax=Stichopus japonicus TaxID=307972 RepID=A0A2G8JLZ6_STIJA|nr:putative monocarboxylate transporter 13 [Apostichopus japonicus]